MKDALIILDRDGVINKLLIDPVTGLTDSPMNIEQIEIFPWVPYQLKKLTKMGYGIVVATNQPAAAKGKISRSDLEMIHINIIIQAASRGAIILDNFVCFHRTEDNCDCRKPKAGLLEQAFITYPIYDKSKSWMVGDRATDIIAGHRFGLQTALIGPSVENDMEILKSFNIKPTWRIDNLRDFVKRIKHL